MEGLSHIMKASNGQQKNEEVQQEPSQQQVDAFLSQNDGVLDMVEKIASGKIAQGKKNGEIFKPDSFDKMIKGIAKQVMIENRQQKMSTAATIEKLREEASRNLPTQSESPKPYSQAEAKKPIDNAIQKDENMGKDILNSSDKKIDNNEQPSKYTEQKQDNIKQKDDLSGLETPPKKQKVNEEQDLLGGFEDDFFKQAEPGSIQKESSGKYHVYNQPSVSNDDLFDSIMDYNNEPPPQQSIDNSKTKEAIKGIDSTTDQIDSFPYVTSTNQEDTKHENDVLQKNSIQQGYQQTSGISSDQGFSSQKGKSSETDFFDSSSQKFTDATESLNSNADRGEAQLNLKKQNNDVQQNGNWATGDSDMSFKSTTEQPFASQDSNVDSLFKDANSNPQSSDSTAHSQAKTTEREDLLQKQNTETEKQDSLLNMDIEKPQQHQEQKSKDIEQGSVQQMGDATQDFDWGFRQDESMAWSNGPSQQPFDKNGADSITSKEDHHQDSKDSDAAAAQIEKDGISEDVNQKENQTKDDQTSQGLQKEQAQSSLNRSHEQESENSIKLPEHKQSDIQYGLNKQISDLGSSLQNEESYQELNQQASLNDSANTLRKDQVRPDGIDDSARSKDFNSSQVSNEKITDTNNDQYSQSQFLYGTRDSLTMNGSATRYECSSTTQEENSAEQKEFSANSSLKLSQQKEIIKTQSGASEAILTVDGSNVSEYPKMSLGSDQFFISRSQKLGQGLLSSQNSGASQKREDIRTVMDRDYNFREWPTTYDMAYDKNLEVKQTQNKDLNDLKDMTKFFRDLPKSKNSHSGTQFGTDTQKQNVDTGKKTTVGSQNKNENNAAKLADKSNDVKASNEYIMQQEKLMEQQIEKEEKEQQEQLRKEKQRKKAERRKRSKANRKDQNRLDKDVEDIIDNSEINDNDSTTSDASYSSSSSSSTGSSKSTLTAHSLPQKQSDILEQSTQSLGFLNQKDQPNESPTPTHPLFTNSEISQANNQNGNVNYDPIFGEYSTNNNMGNKNVNGRDQVYASIANNRVSIDKNNPKEIQFLKNLSLSSATTSDIGKQQSDIEDQLKVYSNISFQSRANSGYNPDINLPVSTTAFQQFPIANPTPRDMPVADRKQGNKISQDPQLSGIMSFQKDIREQFEKQITSMRKLKQEQEQVFVQQQNQMQEKIMDMEGKFNSWSRLVYEWQKKKGIDNPSFIADSYENQLENKLSSAIIQNQQSSNYPLFDMFLHEDTKQKPKLWNSNQQEKDSINNQTQLPQQNEGLLINSEGFMQQSHDQIQPTAPNKENSSVDEKEFRNYLNSFTTQQKQDNYMKLPQSQITPSQSQQFPTSTQTSYQKLHTPESSIQSAKNSRSMQLLQKQKLNSVVTLKNSNVSGTKIPRSAPAHQAAGSLNYKQEVNGSINTGNENLNSTLKNLMDMLPYTYDVTQTKSGQPHTQVFQQTTDLGQQAIRTCVVTVQYPIQKEEQQVNGNVQQTPDVVQTLDFSSVDGKQSSERIQSRNQNLKIQSQAQSLGNQIAAEGNLNGNLQQIESSVLKLIRDDVFSTRQYLQSLSPQIMTVNKKLDLLLGQVSIDSQKSSQLANL